MKFVISEVFSERLSEFEEQTYFILTIHPFGTFANSFNSTIFHFNTVKHHRFPLKELQFLSLYPLNHWKFVQLILVA